MEMKFIVKNEEIRLHDSDSIPSKIMTYSVVTLIVLSILAFVQMKYLKSFFRHKKLI